ncbi:MAG: HNH endonuclease [Ferrimicrobium sp.]|jgi:5-methylcytosine-specific restriction endonuclease McrA|uniref:HNH endonuclease n=1 Tax=Ferrimicrobium acidiphilum TaxID=121039 RepID=A0ABV3XYX2_9ACTN|nr:HNH endonuclease [Ferrimicrobium sp.]MCL5972797.1 HNH endonuclease [Actinomycetota bacterium]
MAGVLVLNASYEALCVVSTHRAIGLVVVGKADVVLETSNVLRSARMTIPEPSVIKLRYFVRVPHLRRVAPTKRAIFARDHHRCQYCGAPAENVDHVIPRSRGGQHRWDNVVASCRSCNSRKRDRMLSETNFVLRRPPETPRGRTSAIILLGLVRDEWLPYLDGDLRLEEPSLRQLSASNHAPAVQWAH